MTQANNVLTLKPGQRVRIQQQVNRREGDWLGCVEGVVVEVAPHKTGSWFAHGVEDKLWLNRIKLRKPDGEVTLLVVDPSMSVEILE
jgi:hypothetical protein